MTLLAMKRNYTHFYTMTGRYYKNSYSYMYKYIEQNGVDGGPQTLDHPRAIYGLPYEKRQHPSKVGREKERKRKGP